MATYTYTTTASEDAGLEFVLGRVNLARAAENPPKPALTAADYLSARVREILASYQQQQKAVDEGAIMEAYRTADALKQAAIKVAAGV
mgnify:CR=1 FL=1